MQYLDTNVLIYSIVNQDPEKRLYSQSLIQDLFERDLLLLSPLSIQELIFTLSKLKAAKAKIANAFSLFTRFCLHEISCETIEAAFSTVLDISFGRNINDIIHLKFAERYCDKLITFDKDFKRLIPYSSIAIEVINWQRP